MRFIRCPKTKVTIGEITFDNCVVNMDKVTTFMKLMDYDLAKTFGVDDLIPTISFNVGTANLAQWIFNTEDERDKAYNELLVQLGLLPDETYDQLLEDLGYDGTK